MMKMLQTVYLQGGLYHGPYAFEAARRYEQIWLPLLALSKAKGNTRELIPPLDIAFAWLIHRLHPVKYAQDCKDLLGAELEETGFNRFNFADEDALYHAEGHRLWGLHYTSVWNSEDLLLTKRLFDTVVEIKAKTNRRLKRIEGWRAEHYFQPTSITYEGLCTRMRSFKTSLRVNLPAAMSRQAPFLHSLLRPCYLELPFLRAGLAR
jgi:hypothetical protein